MHATLADVVNPRQRIGDRVLRLRQGVDLGAVRAALAGVGSAAEPAADARAVAGLKFSAALPDRLARATVGERLGDADGARAVLGEPRRLVVDAG